MAVELFSATLLTRGRFWSRLRFDTVTVLVLPAWSSTWPVTDWFEPFGRHRTGELQVLTPDSASEKVERHRHSLLFQPWPFATGVTSM